MDEYVDKFKIGLMDVTLRWCRGEKFADIIKGQDLFEGSVIRCIRRLEELVVQMSNVCKVRTRAPAERPLNDSFVRTRLWTGDGAECAPQKNR